MAYDTNFAAPQHRLEMDGREHLIVSGVEDVDRFDETPSESVMTFFWGQE